MPCFFLSSEVTNLDRTADRVSRRGAPGGRRGPGAALLLQVLQEVFSVEHGDERGGGSGDDDDGRPGAFGTKIKASVKK